MTEKLFENNPQAPMLDNIGVDRLFEAKKKEWRMKRMPKKCTTPENISPESQKQGKEVLSKPLM